MNKILESLQIIYSLLLLWSWLFGIILIFVKSKQNHVVSFVHEEKIKRKSLN